MVILNLEVVSTGRDGQEVVRVVNKGEEVSITGNERIRVRSANDDGDAGPAETVLPSLTIVGVQGRNVPPHANDNLPSAANDNRPPVLDERMVANGDFEPVITEAVPPVIPRTGPELVVDNGPTGIDRSRVTATNGDGTDGGNGNARRPTLRLNGDAADRARDRLREVLPPAARPAVVKPPPHLPPEGATQEQRLKLSRISNDLEGKNTPEATSFKENLAWFNGPKENRPPNFDERAYADLLIMQANVRFDEGVEGFVIPLKALRNADVATMRFVRDRFEQVNPNFRKPDLLTGDKAASTDSKAITDEVGSRYEYAAQRYLMHMSNAENGPMKDWVFIPGTQGSPLDHAKIDGIFVGIGENNSGRIVPVDFKASPKARDQADPENDWTLFLGRNADNNVTTAGDVAGLYNSNGTFNGIDHRTVVGNLQDFLSPDLMASRSFDINLFGSGPGKVDFPTAEPLPAIATRNVLRKWVAQAAAIDERLGTFAKRSEESYPHLEKLSSQEAKLARQEAQRQEALKRQQEEALFQDNYSKYKRELNDDELTVDEARRMEEVRVILEQNDRTGFNAVDLYLIQSEINGSGISADAVLRHYSGQ